MLVRYVIPSTRDLTYILFGYTIILTIYLFFISFMLSNCLYLCGLPGSGLVGLPGSGLVGLTGSGLVVPLITVFFLFIGD